MLTGSDLVVTVLHLDAHLLQDENGIPPEIAGDVWRCQVEVTTLIQEFCVLGISEIEVFQLRSHVECITQIGRPLQIPLEDISWVAFEGLTSRSQDVAEHPGNSLLPGPPGEDLEGGGVGQSYHIALIDAGKAFYGGAIESHSIF